MRYSKEDFLRQVDHAMETWDVSEEETEEAVACWRLYDEEAADRLEAFLTLANNMKSYLAKKYGS